MSPYFSTDRSSRRPGNTGHLQSENKKVMGEKPGRKLNKKRKVPTKKTVEDVDVDTPSAKKSRRSVRSVFYKEFDTEESQTDDEEYIRIVEERFGVGEPTKDDHDNNDNKTSEKKKAKIVLKSPARFRCQY